MKVSIQEAYKMAKKVLPDHHISVEIQIGRVPFFSSPKGPEWIQWTVTARKDEDTESCADSDEIFSVALARVCAELGRKSAKVVDDVEVDEPKLESVQQDVATDDMPAF